MNDFVKATQEIKRQIAVRARELYPQLDDMWSENSIGYEGGVFCQEDAMTEARESLETGLTAAEWTAQKDAGRRITRFIYLSPEEDNGLRVLAFRTGRSINDIIIEALRDSLCSGK